MANITVRGAGIFGLSIAWALVQRGAKVRVVDPHGPASGSSGGVVGALAPHVPENWNSKKAFQYDSLLMAEPFWRDVAQVSGVDPGYLRLGRLQPIMDDRALELARARMITAADLWQGKALWQVVKAGQDHWQPHSPTGWLIHDTLSAHIHPRRACAALVAALAKQGALFSDTAPDSTPTIWATGVAGLEELSAAHSRSMGNGVKGQAALLAYDGAGLPQIYADGVHIIPHADGTVAIGSTSERDYTSPTTTDALLDDVIAKARTVLQVLGQSPVTDRWAGIRPRARSRAPMLGPWPGRPGHFIANGGFKIGFGMAPKVAQVMADLVLERGDNIPEGFRVADNF